MEHILQYIAEFKFPFEKLNKEITQKPHYYFHESGNVVAYVTKIK